MYTTRRSCNARYEKWGVVFEFYDALNTTDPTQTLRKPAKRDDGACTPGIEGPAGHCGIGGIREYNFCAGIALMFVGPFSLAEPKSCTICGN